MDIIRECLEKIRAEIERLRKVEAVLEAELNNECCDISPSAPVVPALEAPVKTKNKKTDVVKPKVMSEGPAVFSERLQGLFKEANPKPTPLS